MMTKQNVLATRSSGRTAYRWRIPAAAKFVTASVYCRDANFWKSKFL